MPIHIDLKRFNKSNVKGSFIRTLEEKYCSEYDPKKRRIILLMDGYDEIAGGCQQNLYDIQQLNQYSKNLRVIITCRTQYLRTGYQQWFKPAEGRLKEFEIQQFNEDQIRKYLENYSREAEKIEKQNCTLLQYQEKIEAYPNLKDLIVNPFMLRLVADALPRISEYLDLNYVKAQMKNPEEEKKVRADKMVLNRYAIYECFMDHWFAKQELRLMESSEISTKWQAIGAFRDFSRKIALILLSKREIEIKIREDKLWGAYFSDTNPDMVRARNGCPLRRENDDQYSFIHKSFLEYFAANGILDSITNKSSRLHKTIRLSPEMITQNMGVISFFHDAFALDPALKKACFMRINESKSDHQNPLNAINAANSMTLLNVLNFNSFIVI